MDNPWAFLSMLGLVLGQIVLTLIGQRRSKSRGQAREVKLIDVVNKVGVIKDVADKVDVIKQEVKNDHPDDANLRDQLDRIERNQEAMAGDLRGVKKDVGRLADAAVDDRETHRTDIARVDGELKDLRRRMP